jgi:hypothetical protein
VTEHPQGVARSDALRIDLLHDVDVAYWCRLLDVDHSQLRRAVQRVGPRADAVARDLERERMLEAQARR